MIDYIVIKNKDLPAIYPDAYFYDEKNIERDLVNDGLYIAESIKTDEKFSLSNEGSRKKSTNQLIQSKIYQKYKFFIFASEYENIELIEVGQTLTITKKDESVINVKVIEIEKQFVDDTFNIVYHISAYNLDNDSKCINNYLLQDNLLRTRYGRFDGSLLNRLTFTANKSVYTSYISTLNWNTTRSPNRYNFEIPVNDFTDSIETADVITITSEHEDNNYLQGIGIVVSVTATIITIALPVTAQNGFTASNFQISWEKTNAINFTFYTILSTKFINPEYEFIDEQKNRGLQTFSQSNTFKIIRLRLYLTAAERDKLNYIYYCKPQNILITDKNNNETYRASTINEIIEFTNNNDLVDIYEVNINLKYDLQTFNN